MRFLDSFLDEQNTYTVNAYNSIIIQVMYILASFFVNNKNQQKYKQVNKT